MECCGVRFDREYSEGAIVYLDGIIKKAEKDFEKIAGRELVDSQIVLGETFQKLGVDVPGFKKASYDDDALSKIDHPLAGIMQTWRKASKKANTYFRNFLALGDYNNIIHTGFRQGGTRTGRLSCAQPNLQNLTKDREGRDWPIRRAFIPRDNKYFVMIDYDQMEYRFMMDMAAEMDIIKAVLGGLDVHTATAEKTGITRDKAKTLNFLLIYGGGINAICNKLGIEAAAATLLRNKYFAGLPRTRKLTTDIQSIARSRGYVFNWKGRRYYFSDPTKAYKAPNYIVQGGCSDIIKLAMNNIAAFLKDVPNVKMLLQVHDEIIFEMTPEEFKHIPMLKSLMENAWKPRYLPLTCSVSHSFKSWQDKVEGEPKWN